MSLLKNALVYSGTNIIAQAAILAQAFVLRALLIPEVMGVWNLVGVIKGYVAPISLGVLLGAFRELPILRGQGRVEEEARCRSVTLTASLAEAGILALAVAGYGVWRYGALEGREFWVFITAALLVIASRLQESYVTFFQGAQMYVPLSRILLINGLIYAIILPVGTISGGLLGLFLAALAAEMFKGLCLVHSGKVQGLQTGFGYDKEIFKRLLSFGVGFRLADYPMTLFMMLPVLWVTWFMGKGSLALFITATGVFLQATDVTIRFGTVFFTRVLEDYGTVTSPKKMSENFRSFIQLELLVAFPLVCWLVVAVFPLLVRQFIPLYKESISILFILMIGGFFIPANNHLFAIWIAEKRLLPFGISNLFGLMAVGFSLLVFWYLLDCRQLHSVAQAAVIGYALYFSYVMMGIGKELFGGGDALKIYFQVLLAATWTALVLFYSGQCFPLQVTFAQDLIFSVKTAIWTLAALLPLVGYGLWAGRGAHLLLERWQAYRSRYTP